MAIIVCSEHTKAWTRPFDNKKTVDVDVSILTDHMMMEATELGLGSVWICYFKPDVIKQEFRLPDTLEPINILAIGYADRSPADTERHAKSVYYRKEIVFGCIFCFQSRRFKGKEAISFSKTVLYKVMESTICSTWLLSGYCKMYIVILLCTKKRR